MCLGHFIYHSDSWFDQLEWDYPPKRFCMPDVQSFGIWVDSIVYLIIQEFQGSSWGLVVINEGLGRLGDSWLIGNPMSFFHPSLHQ